MSFPGFAISGFRSLWGDPQWISLGEDLTIVLGMNNAGKSNVLSLFHTHLGPIRAAAVADGAVTSFDALDRPTIGGTSELRVHWPLDSSLDAQLPPPTQRDLQRLITSQPLCAFGVPALPFVAPDTTGGLALESAVADDVIHLFPDIDWAQLASALTSTNAMGDASANVKIVLEWLKANRLMPAPIGILIPPRRAVDPSNSGAQSEAGGHGILARLHELDNPELSAIGASTDQLRRLTGALRRLLADPGLEFKVPHPKDTVNVRLGGNWFRLNQLGTGTEHAILILAAAFAYPDKLLCIEEPDAHMHPALQRRLTAILREARDSQVIIATHSAHIIDDATEAVVVVRRAEGRSEITNIARHALFDTFHDLGYRASDLLQANSVIWVEGPSDRIYLLNWLGQLAPELRAGIDFAVVFYGGALLRHLAATQTSGSDEFVELFAVNQNSWLIADKDRADDGPLKPSVERLKSEIDKSGRAGMWITNGYTIENYVPDDVLLGAAKLVHPSVASLADDASEPNPLRRLRKGDGTLVKDPDKVGIARLASSQALPLNVLDLSERLNEVIEFVRHSTVPVVPNN